MQVRRGGDDRGDLDGRRIGGRAFQGRDQRIERMRKDVEQLGGERLRACPLGVHPDGAEREVAVHLRDRAERRDARHQLAVRWVADLLVSGTHEQAAVAGQPEQLSRLALRLDERLLDVDVRAGEQRLTSGLVVSPRGRAHVDETRLRFPQQLGERRVRHGPRQRGDLPRRAVGRVAYRGDEVRRPHASQGMEMKAGHPAGAREGDAHWPAGRWRAHAPPSLQDRSQPERHLRPGKSCAHVARALQLARVSFRMRAARFSQLPQGACAS